VKDRAATAMVTAAEQTGELQPGGTIVEGTSGNTGIGLAQAAAVLGNRLIVVVPNSIAVEKIDTLCAYGAEVVETPSVLPRDHPEHVVKLAERIAADTPGGWLANQYDNIANLPAHLATTGAAIWADTGGTVTGPQTRSVRPLTSHPGSTAPAPRRSATELGTLITEMIGLLDTTVLPELGKGHYPEQGPAKLAAEMARTLVHELDLAAAEQPDACRTPAPGRPGRGGRAPTPRQ
jgi:NADPH:quinone reductase-like Zn-dependent oxidoreductase